MRTIKRSVSLLLAILCIMSYTGEAFAAGLTDEVEPQDALHDTTSFEQNGASGLESACNDVTTEAIDVPERHNDIVVIESPAVESDVPEAGDDVVTPESSIEDSDIPETDAVLLVAGDDMTGTESPVENSGIPETDDNVAVPEPPVENNGIPETGDDVAAPETPVENSGISETGDDVTERESLTEDNAVPETGDDVIATERNAMPGMKSSLKTESLTPQAQNVSDPEGTEDTSNPEDPQDVSAPEDESVLDPEDPLYYELMDKIDVLVPLTTQTEEMEPLSAPFDFSVDPYRLIESTQAIRYGGGSVEPGARVVFRNRAGDYDFSSQSDVMSVRNRADFPVQVTITVHYDDTENVRLVDAEELENDSLVPMLCIAVTDSAENHAVLNPDGEATIVAILPACEDESDVAEYSFRLKGRCNPNAVWHSVNIDARLSVIWSVSPVAVVEEPAIEDAPDTDSSGGEPPLLVAPNAYMAPAASMPDASVPEESGAIAPSDETGESNSTEPSDETEETDATAPPVETEETGGTEPLVETEETDATEPPVETEETGGTEPSDETEETDGTVPPVETEETGGTEPLVETEETDGMEPSVETEATDATAPPVETEETGGTEPLVEMEETGGTKPSVETEETDATVPPVETEETDGTEPSVDTEESGGAEDNNPAENMPDDAENL